MPRTEKREAGGFRDFQAVVLDGALGANTFALHPLNERMVKEMLPVGNRPLIAHQLDLLERSGFTEAIVITTRDKALREWLREHEERRTRLKVTHVQLNDANVGSATALLQVKDDITGPFFVLSSDLVLDGSLSQMADLMRVHECTMVTMMAKSTRKVDELGLWGIDSASRQLTMRVLPNDTGRPVSVHKAWLNRCPSFELCGDLLDLHCYLFSHAVLDLLEANRDLEFIDSDLVPFLVHKQFSSPEKVAAVGLHLADDRREVAWTLARSQEAAGPALRSSRTPGGRTLPPSGVKCMACVVETLAKRADTVAAFREANRAMLDLHTPDFNALSIVAVGETRLRRPPARGVGVELGSGTRIGDKCAVGDHTRLGASCVFAASVVGSHCVIGDGVELENSIVMDNVCIETGCMLTNCVVGSNVTIKRGACLNNCLVSAGMTIAEDASFVNEKLAHESHFDV